MGLPDKPSFRAILGILAGLPLLACQPLESPPAARGRVELFSAGDPLPESDVVPGKLARFVTPAGETWELNDGEPVRWASVDPGGRAAATVGVDRVLRVVSLEAGAPGRGTVVAMGVFEAPVFAPAGSGELLFAALDPEAEGNGLFLRAPSGSVERVVPPGSHNDRATFSPDGGAIAFVSDRTGLPAVFVLDLRSGATTQLTNVGVRRIPGRAPEGYVPPPVEGALRWTDAGIEYDSPLGAILLDPGVRR